MDFKALFEQAPFGMVVSKADGETTLVNKSCCCILGYSTEELLSMQFNDIVHSDDRKNFGKELQSLFLRESPSIQIRVKVNSKSGKILSLLYKANLIETLPDNFLCLAEIAAEEKPEGKPIDQDNNLIYLNALMERSPDVIYFKNENSQLIKMSNSYKERFGQPGEDLLGKTDFDFFTGDHAQRAFEDEMQIMQTGVPLINIEEKETTLKGEVTWASTSKMPLRDEDGNIIGTFGISRDISIRKSQEAEIKEKNNILSAITSNMPVVIYKYDKHSGVTSLYGNPRLIAIFEKSKMVKLGVSEGLSHIISKGSSQKNQQGYLNFQTTNSAADNECYFENFVFKNEFGNDEYIGLALDITNHKVTQQNLKRNSKKLEKINEELNQFSYIVSHDLKAPLRAVTNLSEWIEEDLKDFDNEETKANLKLMRGRIRRMENLINGILIYSRVSRGHIKYEEVDVNKLIREIIDSLSVPQNFSVVVQKDLPKLIYPVVNLEQVFSNLISNAIKYHDKPNGNIAISHFDNGEFHEFRVADDGPGIGKEYHEKIFQIFQTLQSRDSMESTGIGLTIVKKIVEERGGSIWVESEPGQGAKFIFTVPKNIDRNLTNQNTKTQI